MKVLVVSEGISADSRSPSDCFPCSPRHCVPSLSRPESGPPCRISHLDGSSPSSCRTNIVISFHCASHSGQSWCRHTSFDEGTTSITRHGEGCSIHCSRSCCRRNIDRGRRCRSKQTDVEMGRRLAHRTNQAKRGKWKGAQRVDSMQHWFIGNISV